MDPLKQATYLLYIYSNRGITIKIPADTHKLRDYSDRLDVFDLCNHLIPFTLLLVITSQSMFHIKQHLS